MPRFSAYSSTRGRSLQTLVRVIKEKNTAERKEGRRPVTGLLIRTDEDATSRQ